MLQIFGRNSKTVFGNERIDWIAAVRISSMICKLGLASSRNFVHPRIADFHRIYYLSLSALPLIKTTIWKQVRNVLLSNRSLKKRHTKIWSTSQNLLQSWFHFSEPNLYEKFIITKRWFILIANFFLYIPCTLQIHSPYLSDTVDCILYTVTVHPIAILYVSCFISHLCYEWSLTTV